jgi:hypothetical protein
MRSGKMSELDELKDRISRAAKKLWVVVNNQNPHADGKAEVREALAILTGEETVGCPGCGLTLEAHGPDCPVAKTGVPIFTNPGDLVRAIVDSTVEHPNPHPPTHVEVQEVAPMEMPKLQVIDEVKSYKPGELDLRIKDLLIGEKWDKNPHRMEQEFHNEVMGELVPTFKCTCCLEALVKHEEGLCPDCEKRLEGEHLNWKCPTCGRNWVATPGHERCLNCQPLTEKEVKRMHLQPIPADWPGPEDL